MHTFTFKASDDIYKRLSRLAKAEERPKSYFIRKAVEEYIAEMEEDEADLKIALERLNDPAAEYIPWEEVQKQLGLDSTDRKKSH